MSTALRFGTKAATFASAVIAAAVMALPQTARGQQNIAPMWVNDTWRSAKYPQSEWVTGFAQDGLKSGADAAAALKRVEQSARNNLSENISSRLTSASRNETSSSRVTTTGAGAQSRETVAKNYGQIISSSTSAEVVKTELHPWHDTQNNRVYAFAAVKKSALASYYAGMIDAGLGDAERGLELAKQSAELGKKKDATDKLAEGKKKIESLDYYRDLLIAVDDNGLARAQGDRVTRLLKEIGAALAEAEDAAAVFVTGTETILGAPVDIIVPALQTIVSDKGFRVTEKESEAGYILKIEATACNVKPPATQSFYFADACVKVVLTSVNAKTGKSKAEVTATLTGVTNGNGKDAREAAEEAFNLAAPEVWKKVSGKVVASR